MNKILLAILSLSLAGCVGVPEKAKTDLVGMGKEDLYSCAGVPDVRDQYNGVEIFEYKQTHQVESPLNLKGPFSLELDLGGKGLCNAIFRIENSKVVRLEYVGPSATAFGPLAACEPLIKACENFVKGKDK